MQTVWESEIAAFLRDLSAVQDRTLDLLTRKRRMLVEADQEGLAALGTEEQGVLQSLQECLQRRESLLDRAGSEGLPSDSIRSLTRALPRGSRRGLLDEVDQARSRARLLHHHGLLNCVLVQKTLIHLSQLLEIIATGGRLQPTYGKAVHAPGGGALVDREV